MTENDLAAITGELATPAGQIPVVSAEYRRADKLTAWKARWGIGRMALKLKPGLYALGAPTAGSPVFATANYKLSFDALRTSLKNTNAWILLLDTRGINVWCAAGKGTFGTMELTRQLMGSGIEKLVTHRKVILPQLGAPGVAAHRVKAYTGFSVVYGPVRACDIPEFMKRGSATPEMRSVRFDFMDRIILAPMELVYFSKYLLPTAALLFLLGLKTDSFLTLVTLIASTLLVPALLPWLPGRSFAVKSAFAGMIGLAAAYPLVDLTVYQGIARALIYVPAASFIGLEFTGASTYTSLSGVLKEMRAALPAQAACLAGGLLMLAVEKLI